MVDREQLISDLRDRFTLNRWIDMSDLEGATFAVDFFIAQITERDCGDPDCSCPECPTGRQNEHG